MSPFKFCNHLTEVERERESWLFYFNCVLAFMSIIVPCLFLLVPWVGLWCVIVAFPSHTHLLFQDLCSSLEPYGIIWEIAELPLCLFGTPSDFFLQ